MTFSNLGLDPAQFRGRGDLGGANRVGNCGIIGRAFESLTFVASEPLFSVAWNGPCCVSEPRELLCLRDAGAAGHRPGFRTRAGAPPGVQQSLAFSLWPAGTNSMPEYPKPARNS